MPRPLTLRKILQLVAAHRAATTPRPSLLSPPRDSPAPHNLPPGRISGSRLQPSPAPDGARHRSHPSWTPPLPLSPHQLQTNTLHEPLPTPLATPSLWPLERNLQITHTPGEAITAAGPTSSTAGPHHRPAPLANVGLHPPSNPLALPLAILPSTASPSLLPATRPHPTFASLLTSLARYHRLHPTTVHDPRPGASIAKSFGLVAAHISPSTDPVLTRSLIFKVSSVNLNTPTL